MKILISAYGCIPGHGSEWGGGWNLVEQVAKHYRCWVITNTEHKPIIEDYVERFPLPNATFIYVTMPKKNGLIHYGLYILWQIKAFFAAKKLLKEEKFDFVHHLTYKNSWQPTWMGWLGIPFIWSAGSKDKMPAKFWPILSKKSVLGELMREALMQGLGTITYWVTAKRANLILARDANHWPSNLPVKTWMQIGLNQKDIEKLNATPTRNEEVFRVASIGRLLGWKGFNMGMRAFAQMHRQFPKSEYWIMGDGPERMALETLAKELGIEDSVRFLGEIKRSEVFQNLAEVDVVLHPSLHELFGTILLEAMAAGRPAVCLDIGGPSLMVADNCGIKVPAHNPDQAVVDLTAALLELANNPEKRLKMGESARVWIRDNWSWNAVGGQLVRFYKEFGETEVSVNSNGLVKEI